MGLICPKCGAKEEEKNFIESFCEDCYEFGLKIPQRGEVKFKLCPRCERIFLSGEWQKYGKGKIADYVSKKCRGDFEDMEYDAETGVALFTFFRNGKNYKVRKKITAEIEKNLCEDCNRMSGGYFEGIVQVRGENRDKVERYAEKMKEALEKKTFVSKVEEKKEGIDLYIGSSKAVMRLLEDGGLKPLITTKLFGRKEGKPIYRTTFLLRLE